MRIGANQEPMDQKMSTATTFDTVGGTAPLRATSEWAELERRLRLAVVAVENVDFAGVCSSLHDGPGDHLVPQLDTRLAAKHLLGAAVGGRQVSTPAHPTNQWS
jgi:hypothetical protein